jgi:hypothetical protein
MSIVSKLRTVKNRNFDTFSCRYDINFLKSVKTEFWNHTFFFKLMCAGGCFLRGTAAEEQGSSGHLVPKLRMCGEKLLWNN